RSVDHVWLVQGPVHLGQIWGISPVLNDVARKALRGPRISPIALYLTSGATRKAALSTLELKMMIRRAIHTVSFSLLVLLGSDSSGYFAIAAASADDAMPGVNLPSGSFNASGSRIEFDYTYPTEADIDYYTGKGFKIFRVSFLAKRLIVADGEGPLATS